MTFTRREFIKAGAVAGLAGIMGVPEVQAQTFKAPPESLNKPEFYLNQATLKKHLKTRFAAETGGTARDVRLRLIEVVDRGSGSASPSYECFSAYFSGSKTKPLDQGTYILRHRVLGRFELFLVPAGSGRKNLFYEALFNRI